VDERRARIFDDLRGAVNGELYFETLDRAPYAHDASLYEIDPLGVVVPRSEDDVVIVARYAAENGIPIHARGAGTDTGGGALGAGLVVDLSRHLRRIIATGPEHVIVEAGVVPDLLNAQLAPLGRRLEPIVQASDVTTLGGLIAVDAAGGRSLRYGSTGDQVDWLRGVLASGDVAELGYEPWPAFEAEPVDLKDLIVRKLQTLYRRGGDRLRRARAALPRDRAGYALGRAADESGIHLGRLVAGSEGTLALITQARLRTIPLPAAQAVVVLPFRRMSEAMAFVPELLDATLAPSSCDLLDRRSLHLARDADVLFRDAIDEPAESILVVEFEGNDPEAVSDKVRHAGHRAARLGHLASRPSSHFKRAECERLLGWRRIVESLMMRFRGPARPVSVFDDAAVAPDRLASVLHKLQALLQQENVTWTLDAYAGEGRIRVRPFLDLSDPRDRARLEPLAAQVYAIVLDAGGTISSSRACGLLRTQFLRAQCGELVPMFREIKDAFDPLGQLNPGKVIGDDPHLMIRDLRRLTPLSCSAEGGARSSTSSAGTGSAEHPSADRSAAMAGPAPAEQSGPEPTASRMLAPVEPVLIWPELPMLDVASSCHGCGACRTLDPALRMCPSFRALRDEAASPRAQANLVRQVATGAVDPRLWGTDEMKAHADLCIHCKLCRSECPSGVDVSSLMLEAKAAYVEQHGLPPSDWIFSRLELWARLGTTFPILTNFLLTRRWSRALLERVLGVSRHRVLPRVRRTSFTRRAARLGLHKPRPQQPGPRVVYFVDIFANYYDQELAEAAVAVLRHAEVNVFVPPQQRSSGMAALVVGDIDHAREQALANLRVLANAVRDGYTVVCSEPTAALMLRDEYIKLTEDLDAELVAAHTLDLGQYLLGLEARGQLPLPHEPLHARVGYHQPCHLRALDVGTPGLELLRKIPELAVEFIDRGCSGMGGTYGLARERFRNSLRAGRGLIHRFRDDDIDIGATECGACRIQMEQGSPKRTLHPMKLLSLSYGLNPLLRQHFKDPKPRNVMS
jgi:FAD/FMN-containing dehydrogenase/Fe-S oxidoreductase